MSGTLQRASAEEIAELERLSRAQLDAAKSGDLEEVRLLLGIRQRLLQGLQGRVVQPGDLDPVMASDAETIVALRAEIRRVEHALSCLNTGSRALLGYAMKASAPPAFLDQTR